ncbi:MAG: DNA adenine methylase [Janthinobacterium lividum]
MQNITSNEELMLSNIAQFESVNIEYHESIPAVKIFEEIKNAEARPFVKWVGGKRSLSKAISLRTPTSFNDYYEPFLGGGAIFFKLQPRRAFISDLNLDLIITYTIVRDEPLELMKILSRQKANHCKDYYYAIRQNSNSSNPVEIAARFIYLNKTCFNGLHRVNSKGEFNVPIGSYINPNILDEENIIGCSNALKNADIKYQDFIDITPKAKDFIYFDPPYQPIKHDSFTRYTKSDFTQVEQVKLFEKCIELDRQGVYFLLSNSDSELIKELYRDFTIDTVNAPRTINCKVGSRQGASEVLIRNY